MLSYDPKQIPTPATETQMFLNAILIELRLIRIALEKQHSAPTMVTMDRPVTKRK